jgi:hypothetical protein
MESAPVDSPRANRRETVLKKAGIIVTASVAGLLAVAPMAFAQEPVDPAPVDPGTTVTFTDDHSCRGGDVTGAQGGLLSLIGGIPISIPFLNCNDVNVLSNQLNNGA